MNICIMGLLDLLVEVVFIPPLPISVATKSEGISLDDCCCWGDLDIVAGITKLGE